MPTIFKLNCNYCGVDFNRELRQMPWYKKSSTGKVFCSRKCSSKDSITAITAPCGNCKKSVTRTKKEFESSKSGFIFCNNSCAATYNNRNKQYGTRRSKLEIHIEECLKRDFPYIELICNSKKAIGSELDFYFPELNIAIELNGIFHYEPIYGIDKLRKIQENDRQKIVLCKENHIDLHIINSSKCKYLTKNNKEKYYFMAKELLAAAYEKSLT